MGFGKNLGGVVGSYVGKVDYDWRKSVFCIYFVYGICDIKFDRIWRYLFFVGSRVGLFYVENIDLLFYCRRGSFVGEISYYWVYLGYVECGCY